MSEQEGELAITNAWKCAKMMLETASDILNPILKLNNLGSPIDIGVGLSSGDVVVTQIGVGDAQELTVYGTPIDHACKASTGQNEIHLAKSANDIFPRSNDGTIKLRQFSIDEPEPLYRMEFPSGFNLRFFVNLSG